LIRLRRLLQRGLQVTALLWPVIILAYGWVHQVAHILANEEDLPADRVQDRYQAVLDQLEAGRAAAGSLAPAIDQFLKVSTSSGDHLFHCYSVPGLPRTNNALEQFFGSARYHERRASGRKGADPSLVVRGAVRIVAAVATRQHPCTGADLRPHDLARWRALRRQLGYRHQARRAQRSFRRSPQAYLARLEAQLLMPSLPA
jgi:hypothetical protein